MVRRTSKKDKKISKKWKDRNTWWERFMRKARNNSLVGPILSDEREEVNEERILGVRNRYLERLRENQVAWLTETQNERVREHRAFHAIYHGPGTPANCEICFDGPLTFMRPKITGYCSICSSELTEDFPEDYPEEFKFCCSCLGWAKSILTDKNTEWLKNALKVSPTVKKVYERITVYNGDKRKK